MKRFGDYTPKELFELSQTEGAIERLVDLECAFNNLPLLPADPGPKPEVSQLTPDKRAFTVCGVTFLDMVDAADLLEFLSGRSLYTSTYKSGGHYVAEPVESGNYRYPKIEQTELFSEATYEKHKERINNEQRTLNEWEAKRKDYDRSVELRKEVHDEIWGVIHAFRRDETEIERIKADYARYLDLAEGNENIAYGFLCDAREDDLRCDDDGSVYFLNEDGLRVLIEGMQNPNTMPGCEDDS